jgi:hypothetical protein
MGLRVWLKEFDERRRFVAGEYSPQRSVAVRGLHRRPGIEIH